MKRTFKLFLDNRFNVRRIYINEQNAVRIIYNGHVSLNPPYIAEMYAKIILTNDTTCDTSVCFYEAEFFKNALNIF